MVADLEGIDREDIAVLDDQDYPTLARWWCDLNRWNWPQGLPNPEAADWDPTTRRFKILAWIDRRIPHRMISREWNNQMTDEEFNDFYSGVYQNDKAAKMRHDWHIRILSLSRKFEFPG